MSLDICIGAMIDLSSSTSTSQTEEGKAGNRCDGCQYFYQQGGNNALTVLDLQDHCSSIATLFGETWTLSMLLKSWGQRYVRWKPNPRIDTNCSSSGSFTDSNTTIINNEMADAVKGSLIGIWKYTTNHLNQMGFYIWATSVVVWENLIENINIT